MDRETKIKPQFYHCGCCEQYHSTKWDGDCREDAERFSIGDLDRLFYDGWTEVDQPD